MTNFYTTNLSNLPQFHTLDRVQDLQYLEPVTRANVEKIISGAIGMGIQLAVTETFRSRERQQQLFATGATKLRNVGVHHFGLAADLCKVINGKPSWDGDWGFLGILCKQYGMVWGGDWDDPMLPASAFHDWDHVQRINLVDQNGLFNGTWYPDETYVPVVKTINHTQQPVIASVAPITVGSTGSDVKRLQIALTAAGCPAAEDGTYGPSTLIAVIDFQSMHGLPADGIVGPDTRKALGL